MDFNYINDIEYAKEILSYNNSEFSDHLGISRMSLHRWMTGDKRPDANNMEKIYNFIYKKGISLNRIKEELYKSKENKNLIYLFHGAKNEIIGNPSVSFSDGKKDFGKGFYLGESVKQAVSFVSSYKNPSLYIFAFDKRNTRIKEYDVTLEWMLLIAYFRGKLEEYSNSPLIKELLEDIKNYDVIKAPIADNTMYSVLEDFISGTITDQQCLYALSANRLGKQYVFLSDDVISNKLTFIEKCYLCNAEKEHYLDEKLTETNIGKDKVKIAKREYAGKGKYIEEIMNEKD